MRTGGAAFIAILVALGPCGALADETPTPAVPAPIHVQVLGAVLHAGVYTLAAGSRLSDALTAAGARIPAPQARPDSIASMIESMMVQADAQRVFLSRIVDGQPTSYQINLTPPEGKVPANPVLREGDHIFVPERRGFSRRIISTSPI